MKQIIERRKIKKEKRPINLILIAFLVSLFSFNGFTQDFGIYDLSAKTNLDSADAFMISQRVDSTYYKVLFDRIVDSVEDSIRGQIINSWIKSGAAIALNKLASGTAAYIIVNNVSGVPTYVALSGDATISNAGVLTIAANAVGSSEITDNSITTSDILDETITTSDIDDGTLVDADISASAAITLSKLATSTAGNIIVYNSGGVPTSTTMSGDATITNAGVVDLADALSDDFTFSGQCDFSESVTGTRFYKITPYSYGYLTSDMTLAYWSASTQTSGVDITGVKSVVTTLSNPTGNSLIGGYFEATGSGTSGGTASYGIWAKGTGSNTNYAGYFEGNINVTGNATVSGNVTADKFYVSGMNTAPSSASDTGTEGEIRIVNGYIYVCVATNTWKRVAISTW